MKNGPKGHIRSRWLVTCAVVATSAMAGAGLLEAQEPLDKDQILALLFPDGPPRDRHLVLEELRELTAYGLGRRIFFEETFGGNGRTCATCHDPRNEFTVSPALVEGRFARDSGHPLFRAIDSDDGTGATYSNLRNLAVFRVSIPLHDDVRVAGDPFARTIEVWRGVPTIANVALTAPFLADGRAATLQAQAAGAIHDHMEPLREPLPDELAALEAFMGEIFYPLRVRTLPDINDPVLVEPGFTVPITSPAAVAGREIFDDSCASCHGGELAHRPDNPHQRTFTTVFVSEANRPGFPMHRLVIKGAGGVETVVETPDPGLAATSGRIDDLNAFEATQLRGLKHTAPYFHDNSAETLEEVVDHYNEFFPEIDITGRRKNQLIAYLETL